MLPSLAKRGWLTCTPSEVSRHARPPEAGASQMSSSATKVRKSPCMCGKRRYPGDVTRFILLRNRGCRTGADCLVRLGSEPAAFLRHPQRLGPVAGAGLLDAGGQVIAHRPLGEEQRGGDLGDRRAILARREHVPLAGGQRAGTLGERGRGELGIDDLLAVADLPDRLGELVRRGIFKDKS